MRFMRIDAKTGELLREFWKVVEPALPTILEGFYQHVTREPQLARMIGSDIPRLKTAQGSHWGRLFNGRFDHEYMQGVRTIGLIHNKIGLEPRWYIGGYNFVLSQLAALAVRQYRWKPGHLSEVLTALNCAVMLDMDIAISVYQEAMLAERQKQQDKITAAIQDFDSQMKIVLKTVGGSATNLQNAANALAASAEEFDPAIDSRRGGLGRGVHQCAGCRGCDRGIDIVGQGNRPSGHRVHQNYRHGSGAGQPIRRHHAGPRQSGAENRRCRRTDQHHRRTNQPAGLECHDRGGTRRRGRQGICRGGLRSEGACGANREGDRRNRSADLAIQEATKESVGSIQEIGATIASVNEIATAIAAAVEEQGMATAEIARNVQEAARGTQEVSSNISRR